MPLGKEVGLGPGHSVLDGDPVGTHSPISPHNNPLHFRPMPIVAKRSPISATTELLFVNVAYDRRSVLLRDIEDRPHRLSTGRGDGSAQRGRSVSYDCLVVFAACVPSCTMCAYTTETTKSYTTCSSCTDLYALTSSNLCSSTSPSSHTTSLSLSFLTHTRRSEERV